MDLDVKVVCQVICVLVFVQCGVGRYGIIVVGGFFQSNDWWFIFVGSGFMNMCYCWCYFEYFDVFDYFVVGCYGELFGFGCYCCDWWCYGVVGQGDFYWLFGVEVG